MRCLPSSRPTFIGAMFREAVSALAFAAGLEPSHAATLEVRGHKTGRLISLPVVVADFNGARPFFPIDRRAPASAFERIVDAYPVFRVV